MRSLKIAGLCLASVLTLGMSLAGNASAAGLLWLVCLEGSGLTKYESSTCLKAASGGKWQSVGVTKELTVKLSVISVLFVDTKTAIGEVALNCPSEGSIGEAVIKSNGEGEVRISEYTAAGAKKCKDEKGNCPEVTKIAAVHLPWIMNIEEGPGGEALTTVKPHAGGEQPGWEFTCKDIVNVTDECELVSGEEGKSRLINAFSATELLVIARGEENAKGHCSQSKENTGEIRGAGAGLLPGGALSIHKG
jgi:hypothetical protein